ncbi:MAG: RdgB/HAM1 family non-canonical purine NTP pyrophosphatase [Ilumatobacteraceae bacterium]|nr:RdgB/HAM1 family non-canonical purine NTP pyrophosphatase [Ilumatobacteraceae bacterium]
MTPPLMVLVCASANVHKVEEMNALLTDIVHLVPRPAELGEVHETGSTLLENAVIKAEAVAAFAHADAIADDTGLEVDALDGAPGVWSARFAGEPPSDARNRALLLERLAGIVNRSARFRTVLAIVRADGTVIHADGTCNGTIALAERGDNGFGYDSVFIPNDGDGRTFAELSSDEKNAMSHRARAVVALRELLPTP